MTTIQTFVRKTENKLNVRFTPKQIIILSIVAADLFIYDKKYRFDGGDLQNALEVLCADGSINLKFLK